MDGFRCTLQTLLDARVLPADMGSLMVTGVQSDSRQVQNGDVFLAYPGALVDGRDYIQAALDKGAAAVIAEAEGLDARWQSVAIPVSGLAVQAGHIAARFYQQPSRKMQIVAVTGTNGKTSVTHLVAAALSSLGKRSAVIGTLGNGPVNALQATQNTTPGAVELQSLLAAMASQGIQAIAMEASSHGLQMGRLSGTGIGIAVVTNISRDHLDFHGSLEAYQLAKARLVAWPGLQVLVLNRDDPIVSSFRERADARVTVLDVSLQDSAASLFADQLVFDLRGVSLRVHYQGEARSLKAPLMGRFNVYNLLAALGALLGAGVTFADSVTALNDVQPVPGRMEVVRAACDKSLPLVVVDYAHTPDALEQVLRALRPHCQGALWCVVGCGGDRDIGKRAEMGRVACTLADRLVLTTDNPRSESPQHIIADIEQGIAMGSSYRVEADRAKAIAMAITAASVKDVVLIAGKGHEDYQEVAGKRIPFSDVLVSQHVLMGRCA